MYYYIKDDVIIAKSETQIITDVEIKEIECNEIFENPFFEEGQIIEYINSNCYLLKEQKEEQEQQEQTQKQILENLLKEKQEAECCGYSCEIIDGQLIKTPTEASRNYEIAQKIKKIDEIEQKVRSLGEVETSSNFLQTVNTKRISNLRAEKLALETQLDELTTGIETSALDDIISAIFS